MTTPITLRCQCCGLPFLRVSAGRVIVVSKHHGEQHTNAISFEELKALMQQELAQVS